MKKTLLLAAFTGILLAGCGGAENTKADYKRLSGYFVRNDAVGGIFTGKITSQEQFDEYFGTAATMDAMPTAIDFMKEFVVAFVLPETDRATQVTLDSVISGDGSLDLYYTVDTGERQSYTVRPALLAALATKYDGRLNFITNRTGEENVYTLDVDDGRAELTVRKESGQGVTFAFDPGARTRLSGTLTSGDASANIRFSQIIMPDGSADGPFGRDIQYDLAQRGTYNLIVHENIMAGDPWAGEFTIHIELTD